MKNTLRQRLLVTAVLCTMLATMGMGSAFAAKEAGEKNAEIVSACVMPVRSSLLNSEVHEQNYLKMLVKAYDAESLTQWNSAFADRKEVTDKITNQIKAAATIDIENNSITIEHGKTIEQDLGKLAGLIDKLKGDNVLKTDLNITDGIKDDRIVVSEIAGISPGRVFKTGVEPINDEEFQKTLTLYEKFSDAVSSSNEQEIKKILPQILNDYRAQTDKMKQELINSQK